MLDAIMEYISTGKLPHVFLEDNVKIHNNSDTNNYITERLKNNKLHKLDYTNIFILMILINTDYRYSKVISKSGSDVTQLPIPLCISINVAKTVVLNTSANRFLTDS